MSNVFLSSNSSNLFDGSASIYVDSVRLNKPDPGTILCVDSQRNVNTRLINKSDLSFDIINGDDFVSKVDLEPQSVVSQLTASNFVTSSGNLNSVISDVNTLESDVKDNREGIETIQNDYVSKTASSAQTIVSTLNADNFITSSGNLNTALSDIGSTSTGNTLLHKTQRLSYGSLGTTWSAFQGDLNITNRLRTKDVILVGNTPANYTGAYQLFSDDALVMKAKISDNSVKTFAYQDFVTGLTDSLDSRITSNENDIDTLQDDVKENTSDISALTTRITTAESDIDTLQSNQSNFVVNNSSSAQTIISTLTGTNFITSTGNLNSVIDDLSGLSSNVVLLDEEKNQSLTSTLTADNFITSNGDLNSVISGLNTAESNISSLQSDVDTLESKMSSAESNISSIDARVTTNESDIANLQANEGNYVSLEEKDQQEMSGSLKAPDFATSVYSSISTELTNRVETDIFAIEGCGWKKSTNRFDFHLSLSFSFASIWDQPIYEDEIVQVYMKNPSVGTYYPVYKIKTGTYTDFTSHARGLSYYAADGIGTRCYNQIISSAAEEYSFRSQNTSGTGDGYQYNIGQAGVYRAEFWCAFNIGIYNTQFVYKFDLIKCNASAGDGLNSGIVSGSCFSRSLGFTPTTPN